MSTDPTADAAAARGSDTVERSGEHIDLVEDHVAGGEVPPADIVAEQLSELIERVEEVLEDEGLLSPEGD